MSPRPRIPGDPTSSPTAPREPDLRYSFKYLDTSHPAFRIAGRDASYFRVLLARLREISSLSISEFRTHRSSSLRIHRIDFSDGRVAVNGFGIPGREVYDREAWQFALSANEHGRVHGFLIRDTFYIRWLDPDHNLYAGTR